MAGFNITSRFSIVGKERESDGRWREGSRERERERGGGERCHEPTFFGEATAPVGSTAALFLLPLPRAPPAEGPGKEAAGFCVLPVATLELWLGEGVEGGTSLLDPAAAVGHTSTPSSRKCVCVCVCVCV